MHFFLTILSFSVTLSPTRILKQTNIKFLEQTNNGRGRNMYYSGHRENIKNIHCCAPLIVLCIVVFVVVV